MMRHLLAFAFFPLLAAGQARGQDAPVPAAGARIRVEYRCRLAAELVSSCASERRPRQDVGALLVPEGDSLRLDRGKESAPLAIPQAAVARVWVADGTRRHFWKGGLIGLVAGGALGALAGSAAGGCYSDCSSGGSATGEGLLVGAAAGFLAGGGIGLLIRGDRWREVDVAGWRAELAPALGP